MQTAVKTRLGQRQPPPLHPPSYHHHHSTTLHHHLIQTYAIRDYSRLLYQSHKSTPLKLMQSVVIFWIKCLKGVVRSNYHIIINRFSKFSCTRNTKVVYMLYIAMRARTALVKWYYYTATCTHKWHRMLKTKSLWPWAQSFYTMKSRFNTIKTTRTSLLSNWSKLSTPYWLYTITRHESPGGDCVGGILAFEVDYIAALYANWWSWHLPWFRRASSTIAFVLTMNRENWKKGRSVHSECTWGFELVFICLFR